MGNAANALKTTKSGFDLTTELLRGGLSKFDLNTNAKLVLLYLATCYNVKKGKVFPKIKTISEAVGISEIGTKRAINELLTQGLILKSKRGNNCNEYVITNKVLKYQDDTAKTYHNDTQTYQDDTKEGITMIPPCKEVKETEIKKTNNKEVAAENLKEIPDIIRKNKDIKNPQAYWRSLDENAKQGYIEKEKEIKRSKEHSAKAKAEQKAYFDELNRISQEPPFYTLYNREEAQNYLKTLEKISPSLINGQIGQYLIEKFRL